MGIKAKFYLQSISESNSGFVVSLAAVTDGSEDNRAWSKYTPSGKLEMSVTNDDALPFFTDLFRNTKASQAAWELCGRRGPLPYKPEVFITIEHANTFGAE